MITLRLGNRRYHFKNLKPLWRCNGECPLCVGDEAYHQAQVSKQFAIPQDQYQLLAKAIAALTKEQIDQHNGLGFHNGTNRY